MSWECCLVESRWRYNELLIRTQSSVTSLFSTVFGDRQQVFLSESGTSLLLQFWSVPLLVFFHLSLSLFPLSRSVFCCIIWMNAIRWDPLRECWTEQMLTVLERVEQRVEPWTEKKIQNRTKSGFSSSHPDIDPAITFLLFLASPFGNGHECIVRHWESRTKQTFASYQQHLNWL